MLTVPREERSREMGEESVDNFRGLDKLDQR
jgi:hypothetical protein